MFRQGDILFKTISGGIPNDAIDTGGRIIALGESTGHKHEMLRAKVMRSSTSPDIQYVEIVEPDKAVHDEHREIRLDAGKYQVIRQREYDYTAQFNSMASSFRTVSD